MGQKLCDRPRLGIAALCIAIESMAKERASALTDALFEMSDRSYPTSGLSAVKEIGGASSGSGSSWSSTSGLSRTLR